jgi:uncharacterized protein with HEPN domain
MQVSNRELLRHMQDEVAFVLQHTAGKTQSEVTLDAVLCRALIRSLEIIGEAARKLDEAFKGQHPQVEWRKMAGTRDRLIHHYFGVDYDIVWDIIKHKLPELHYQLARILGQEH